MQFAIVRSVEEDGTWMCKLLETVGELYTVTVEEPGILASNEPSGCVSIHLANAVRVKYPAACCVARSFAVGF